MCVCVAVCVWVLCVCVSEGGGSGEGVRGREIIWCVCVVVDFLWIVFDEFVCIIACYLVSICMVY